MRLAARLMTPLCLVCNLSCHARHLTSTSSLSPLDDEICTRIRQSSSHETSTQAQYTERSISIWNSLLGNLTPSQTQELFTQAKKLEGYLVSNTSTLDLVDEEARTLAHQLEKEEQDGTMERIIKECQVEKSTFVQQFLIPIHTQSNAHGPLRRLAAQHNQVIGTNVLPTVIHILSWVVGIYGATEWIRNLIGRTILRGQRKVDARGRSRDWVPGWVYKMMMSPPVIATFKYFDHTVYTHAQFMGNIALVFVVLQFIEVIGGLPAIVNILHAVKGLPVVKMVTNLVSETFLYRKIVDPIIVFFGKAYRETADHLNGMTKKEEKLRAVESKGLSDTDRIKAKVLLYDLPEDAFEMMTPQQVMALITAREASLLEGNLPRGDPLAKIAEDKSFTPGNIDWNALYQQQKATKSKEDLEKIARAKMDKKAQADEDDVKTETKREEKEEKKSVPKKEAKSKAAADPAKKGGPAGTKKDAKSKAAAGPAKKGGPSGTEKEAAGTEKEDKSKAAADPATKKEATTMKREDVKSKATEHDADKDDFDKDSNEIARSIGQLSPELQQLANHLADRKVAQELAAGKMGEENNGQLKPRYVPAREKPVDVFASEKKKKTPEFTLIGKIPPTVPAVVVDRPMP